MAKRVEKITNKARVPKPQPERRKGKPREDVSPGLTGVEARAEAGTLAPQPPPMGAAAKAEAGTLAPQPPPIGVAAKAEAGTFALPTRGPVAGATLPSPLPAYVPDSQSWDAAAQIAPLQPNPSIAELSTFGPNNPLDPIGAATGPAPPINFVDIEAVNQWLKGQPPEVAVVFAARAALRVVPALAAKSGRQPLTEATRAIFLRVFRCVAVSWAVTAYPGHLSKLRAAAASAKADFVNAKHAAAYASASAAATSPGDATHSAETAIEYAVDDAAAAGREAFDLILEAFATDASLLDGRLSGVSLTNSQLWSNRAPEWVQEDWDLLKRQLLAEDEGWDVWTDWYEARLHGQATNQDIEVARATIEDETWEQGPKVVNAEIKRLVEERTGHRLRADDLVVGNEPRSRESGADLPGMRPHTAAQEQPAHPQPYTWPGVSDQVQVPAEPTASTAPSETRSINGIGQPQSVTLATSVTRARVSGSAELTLTPRSDVPGIDAIPPQAAAASRFALNADGRIDLVIDPPLADDLQREIYQEVRHKAVALAELGHNQLADLSQPIGRFLAAAPERLEAVSITRLWSRGNTLRLRLKAHETAAASTDHTDPARLPPAVAEMLRDVVETYNVFIVGDPKGRELDQIRIGPQERHAVQAVVDAALPIVEAVQSSEWLATTAAVETLTEQIEAAQNAPTGIEGDQAIDLSRRTASNFIAEMLRGAYGPIRKVIAAAKAEGAFAWKEVRAGTYRYVGPALIASGNLPQIVTFVVENANNLMVFVDRAFHSPELAHIIEIIVQAVSVGTAW